MRPHTISYTRRTLSYAQAAAVIPQYVRALSNDDVHEAATLIADVICDAINGQVNVSPAIIAMIDRRDAALQAPSRNSIGIAPGDGPIAIEGYLAALASPSANEEVLTCVDQLWLNGKLHTHAKTLSKLRTSHLELYEALFAPALYQAVRIGKQADIDRLQLVSLLADHLRFLLVGVAHDRTACVRRIATGPYGDLFCGTRDWKNAGHVLLTTLAEPASGIEQVYRLSSVFEGGDQAARRKLVAKKLLLASDDGDFVFRVGIEARAIIIRRGVSPDNIQAVLDRTAGPLSSVARMTREEVADDGLFQTSVSGVWFGLEPAELTTYIAIELLKALDTVDALVSARLSDSKPALAATTPSQPRIAFAATILRCEGRPDRESLQIGRARAGGGGLDPAYKSSRGPLTSLNMKLRDPVIANRVAQRFGIDAKRLFER